MVRGCFTYCRENCLSIYWLIQRHFVSNYLQAWCDVSQKHSKSDSNFWKDKPCLVQTFVCDWLTWVSPRDLRSWLRVKYQQSAMQWTTRSYVQLSTWDHPSRRNAFSVHLTISPAFPQNLSNHVFQTTQGHITIIIIIILAIIIAIIIIIISTEPILKKL